MSTLSGWCGQLGKPAHQWCKSLVCSCSCHVPISAQNKGNRRGVESVSTVDFWDNKDAPARCVNTTARADRTALVERGSAGA